jgi:hypothetical protein
MFMLNLPPAFAAIASLIDAQPEPVRAAFNYCLALVIVESGKARLAETHPGDSPLCIFETIAGDTFSLPNLTISCEEVQASSPPLRQMFHEEGVL